MQEAAFEAEVSVSVESMIEQLGDRAADQARADLLRALDEGSPEVAVAYEICLRLIERQSRYCMPLAPGPAPAGMLAWLRSWFPATPPMSRPLTHESAR